MKRKDGMPDLVYFILTGVESRTTAYLWVLLSAATAFIFLALYVSAKGSPIAFLFGYSSIGFLVAVCSYLYAGQWVDRYSDWDT